MCLANAGVRPLTMLKDVRSGWPNTLKPKPSTLTLLIRGWIQVVYDTSACRRLARVLRSRMLGDTE